MSTSKLDTSGVFTTAQRPSLDARLALHASEVHFRSNGIEFQSHEPIPAWTEMDVELHSDIAHAFHCTGVVVACTGNRIAGYKVTLCFMNLSDVGQEHLDLLAFTQVQ